MTVIHNRTLDEDEECQGNGLALSTVTQELMLTTSGTSPDPRLVAIAHILARRAARSYFEEQRRDRCKKRS